MRLPVKEFAIYYTFVAIFIICYFSFEELSAFNGLPSFRHFPWKVRARTDRSLNYGKMLLLTGDLHNFYHVTYFKISFKFFISLELSLLSIATVAIHNS